MTWPGRSMIWKKLSGSSSNPYGGFFRFAAFGKDDDLLGRLSEVKGHQLDVRLSQADFALVQGKIYGPGVETVGFTVFTTLPSFLGFPSD